MRRLLVAIALLLPLSALAEDVWLAEEAPSTRFSDAELAGPLFESGEKVELLFEDGEIVRVRKGDRYGWVPATAITRERPADAESDAPGFQLPGMGADGGLASPVDGTAITPEE